MLLGTLGANLLGNIIVGKVKNRDGEEVIRAGDRAATRKT